MLVLEVSQISADVLLEQLQLGVGQAVRGVDTFPHRLEALTVFLLQLLHVEFHSAAEDFHSARGGNDVRFGARSPKCV